MLFGMEIIGIVGMLMVGRKHWWGWLIVLLHSVPWFVYSVMFDKPGFMAMSIMWWATHLYNCGKWYLEKQRLAVTVGSYKIKINNRKLRHMCGTFSEWEPREQ